MLLQLTRRTLLTEADSLLIDADSLLTSATRADSLLTCADRGRLAGQVDVHSPSLLTSITLWSTGPVALNPSPAQLMGFAVSIGDGATMTSCEVLQSPATGAPPPGQGSYAAMGLACGATGQVRLRVGARGRRGGGGGGQI